MRLRIVEKLAGVLNKVIKYYYCFFFCLRALGEVVQVVHVVDQVLSRCYLGVI